MKASDLLVCCLEREAAGPTAGAERRRGLPADVLTIAVDPLNGAHLRAVGDNGQIYESFDSAESCVPVGNPAPVPSDPSRGRHIYRSSDGGQSFVTVVDDGNGIVLINGPVMEADPGNADVLYFPFGSRFAAGVTLYKYDHSTGTTTWQFNTDHTGARALAIDPDLPGVVHIGFEGP
jgi:hypothetical protein